MTTLSQLSSQLLAAGYEKAGDGMFLARDHRRIVVLMEGENDPATWVGQVASALTNPRVTRLPAWARYVVLVHTTSANDEVLTAAAAFSRDVTKCRRVHVFPDKDRSAMTLPFLPLDTGASAPTFAPEVDVAKAIANHLDESLAGIFGDADATHTSIEHEIDRRVAK